MNCDARGPPMESGVHVPSCALCFSYCMKKERVKCLYEGDTCREDEEFNRC